MLVFQRIRPKNVTTQQPLILPSTLKSTTLEAFTLSTSTISTTTEKGDIKFQPAPSRVPIIVVAVILMLLVVIGGYICYTRYRNILCCCCYNYCPWCPCCPNPGLSDKNIPQTRSSSQGNPSYTDPALVVTTEPTIHSASSNGHNRVTPQVRKPASIKPQGFDRKRLSSPFSNRPTVAATRQVADTAKIIGNILTANGQKGRRR